MSPISIDTSRKTPTRLKLNGPFLSYTTQPSSISTCSGSLSANFVGISSVFFSNESVSVGGTLTYQWYERLPNNQDIPLTDSANVVGSATTNLSFLNVTSSTNPTDNQRRFFLRTTHSTSDLIYSDTNPVGRALNNPLDSDIVSLTIFPQIAITSQPQSSTVGTERFADFNVEVSITDTTQGSVSYNWTLNGVTLTDSPNVQGSTTNNLRIKSSSVGNNVIQAVITHPNSCASPLISDSVSFNVVEPREIVRFEGISNSSTAVIREYNLTDTANLDQNSNLVIDYTLFSDNIVYLSFAALETNVLIDLDLYGSKGLNNGSFLGGRGGYSKLRLTLNKDEEYVLLGLRSIGGGGLFLYRKSTLIACVGGGGNAGSSGAGGAGGGVNLSGIPGSGPNRGLGGSLVSSGSLTTTGTFGSRYTGTVLSPDILQSSPNGGVTISCSKGPYWISRGISPCSDVGLQKFVLGDIGGNGITVTNTLSLNRGFKSGYVFITTGGLGLNGGGNGGNGATGGSGGTNGSGGGGGSGYTDSSIQVVQTLSGESQYEYPRMVIRSRTLVFDVEFDVELWGGKGGNYTDALSNVSGGLGGYTKIRMIMSSDSVLQVRPGYQGTRSVGSVNGGSGSSNGGRSSAILFDNEWLAVVGGGGGAGGQNQYDVREGRLSFSFGNVGGIGYGGYSSGVPREGREGLNCTSFSRDQNGLNFIATSTSGGGGAGASTGATAGDSGGTCCCPPSFGAGPTQGGQGGAGNIRIYYDQSVTNGTIEINDRSIFMQYLTHSNGTSSGARIRISNPTNSSRYIEYTSSTDVPLESLYTQIIQ